MRRAGGLEPRPGGVKAGEVCVFRRTTARIEEADDGSASESGGEFGVKIRKRRTRQVVSRATLAPPPTRADGFATLCRRWRRVASRARQGPFATLLARVEVALERVELGYVRGGRVVREIRDAAALEMAARARRGGRVEFFLHTALAPMAPTDLGPFARRAIQHARVRARAWAADRGTVHRRLALGPLAVAQLVARLRPALAAPPRRRSPWWDDAAMDPRAPTLEVPSGTWRGGDDALAVLHFRDLTRPDGRAILRGTGVTTLGLVAVSVSRAALVEAIDQTDRRGTRRERWLVEGFDILAPSMSITGRAGLPRARAPRVPAGDGTP